MSSKPTDEHWQTPHYEPEKPFDKIWRKAQENPFVPIGLALTTTVLGIGFYSFNKGHVKLSQKMMRLRVLAQGATVMAMMGGIAYNTIKKAEETKAKALESAAATPSATPTATASTPSTTSSA